MRIAATPEVESDGPRLADEILAAIAPVTRDGSWDDLPATGEDEGVRSRGPITQEYES